MQHLQVADFQIPTEPSAARAGKARSGRIVIGLFSCARE